MMKKERFFTVFVQITCILALVGLIAPGALAKGGVPQLRFIGEAIVPTGYVFAGTEVGELAGITYNADYDIFYAISDDRSDVNDARFYQLTIDLSDGTLEDGDVVFTNVTFMLDENKEHFAQDSVDPEAISYDPSSSTLYWASEGNADADNLINPFVREMTLDGLFIRELETPAKYLPTADQSSGTRPDQAFESLTLSVRGNKLYTAPFSALFQDGPMASVDEGSPVRVLEFSLRSGKPRSEFVYMTEPKVAPSEDCDPEFVFRNMNGVVEILAIGKSRFLVLERSFALPCQLPFPGEPEFTMKIFLADFKGASKVQKRDSILEVPNLRMMSKHLVLDLDELGIPLSSVEGLTFGPDLPSGERTIILVSDNQFWDVTFTQFLAFALEDD
jgi:hypothetical protein